MKPVGSRVDRGNPTFRALGVGEPEEFRGRIYGIDRDDIQDPRVRFLRKLASEGAIDCPAYDQWVTVLQERGWLPKAPELEANPDGPGKIGRWKLTELGRSEWESMRDDQ